MCLARTSAQRRAFTLIELLVVVSIIALLVSILLPAMGRARFISRRVACSTRLRNLSQACHMYAGDHEDRLPAPAYYRLDGGKAIGGSFLYYGDRAGSHYGDGDHTNTYMGLYTFGYLDSFDTLYCYDGWAGLFGTAQEDYGPSWNMKHITYLYTAGPNEFVPDRGDTNPEVNELFSNNYIHSYGQYGPYSGPSKNTDHPQWRLWVDMVWNFDNWKGKEWRGVTQVPHKAKGINTAYLDTHVTWKHTEDLIPFNFFMF